MKKRQGSFYHLFENKFEKISEFSTRLFGNSVVFLIVLILVVGWFIITLPNEKNLTEQIRSIFIGFSFLTFFLIQRTMNKYNKALHVKINELIRAHENASNDLIKVELKTDHEIEELSKELHKSEN